ncbi:hypothetical protein ACXR2U_06990 [Jatrophihabitans sp. YIM 134969]
MTVSTTVPLPGIDDAAAHFRLAPGVRMLWRGDGSFHLEAGDVGVVVSGLDRGVAASLARPPRPLGGAGPARREPAARPGPVDLATLYRLAELGYVRAEPAAELTDPIGGVLPGRSLDADLGVERPHPTAVRRRARVDVVGVTRVSAYIGALLAAAGVGAVGFASTGTVRRRHLLPGGLTAADEGRRFAAAAADAVARAAPRTDVSPPADIEPDLVVVCLDAPVEPELRELLHRTTRAHLAVHVDSDRGEVGPLVLPGVSACLRCADLHRLDHDPAWSVLAVQLLARAGTDAAPDPGLAVRVGALAADLVLRWLDDDPTAGGTLDGSYELRPGWAAPRRRPRRPHPECGCRAAWG